MYALVQAKSMFCHHVTEVGEETIVPLKIF